MWRLRQSGRPCHRTRPLNRVAGGKRVGPQGAAEAMAAAGLPKADGVTGDGLSRYDDAHVAEVKDHVGGREALMGFAGYRLGREGSGTSGQEQHAAALADQDRKGDEVDGGSGH